MAKSDRQHRHKARILAMQSLFQFDMRHDTTPDLKQLTSFNWMDYSVPDEEQIFAAEIIQAALENLAAIDELIVERLVGWEFSRISPVSRAILRTAVAQLVYLPQAADAAVVIDEAILLAKQYDAVETAGFVNGLLDDVRRLQTEGTVDKSEAIPKAAQKIKIKKKI